MGPALGIEKDRDRWTRRQIASMARGSRERLPGRRRPAIGCWSPAIRSGRGTSASGASSSSGRTSRPWGPGCSPGGRPWASGSCSSPSRPTPSRWPMPSASMPSPGSAAWSPALTASAGLGAFCYAPALALASVYAWPVTLDERPREGYFVNRWAYRDEPPAPGETVWLRPSRGGVRPQGRADRRRPRPAGRVVGRPFQGRRSGRRGFALRRRRLAARVPDDDPRGLRPRRLRAANPPEAEGSPAAGRSSTATTSGAGPGSGRIPSGTAGSSAEPLESRRVGLAYPCQHANWLKNLRHALGDGLFREFREFAADGEPLSGPTYRFSLFPIGFPHSKVPRDDA